MNVKPEPYYQDEFVTLYCGDNRQIVPLLGRFDLLLTDPPYGIGESHKKQSRRGGLTRFKDGKTKDVPPRNFGKNEWDSTTPDGWLMQQIISIADTSIIWGGNYFGLPASSCWLVWDKETNGDFADCELAWTNMPKAVRKFVWRWNGMLQEDMKNKENKTHPTQKPLPLMHWCLSQVPDAKTILDPFAGSGTSLVAAKQKGLTAVGIEIDKRYCEDAANRLRQGVLWEVG